MRYVSKVVGVKSALMLRYSAVNFSRCLKHFRHVIIEECIERADDMLWLAYPRHVSERRPEEKLMLASADNTLANFFQGVISLSIISIKGSTPPFVVITVRQLR
jgi:hypothetical protein